MPSYQHLPTIIPPQPWSSPYEGGYYGHGMLHTQLIRLKVGYDTKALKMLNSNLTNSKGLQLRESLGKTFGKNIVDKVFEDKTISHKADGHTCFSC